MSVISKYKILTKAKESFSKSNYKDALEKFAQVLQNFPNSKEAYNGVILSEMAMSGEGGAEALFDYYEILKEEDKESADIIIDEILQNLDGALDKLSEVLAQPLQDRIIYEDGIVYQDFKAIVADGDNFKEIFENIMFSTKVIITQKEDFIDFLDNLIEHGFIEMALSYIESALNTFPSDIKLIKLLEKLTLITTKEDRSVEN
jgi:tetratricopeptide (TPR) repeat protein